MQTTLNNNLTGNFLFIIFALLMAATGNQLSDGYINKTYLKHIDVKYVIIEQKDICTFFKEESAILWDDRILSNKDCYIIIGIRNNGNRTAWGQIGIKFNKSPALEIPMPLMEIYSKKFKYFVLPLDSLTIGEKHNKTSEIISNISFTTLHTE